MRLNSAKYLDVYKKAYTLAMDIFDISKKLERSGNPELASGKNMHLSAKSEGHQDLFA